MIKEDLFEALGEISSSTVQANTSEMYRTRVLAGYIRLAAIAAAIIAVGTGLYVFKIADLPHRVKDGVSDSGSMLASESPQVATKEETSAIEAAGEAAVERPVGAYASEPAEHENKSAEMSDAMPMEEAVKETVTSNDSDTRMTGNFGLEIKLPENTSWIQELSCSESEKSIVIAYLDNIAGAECTLYGANRSYEEYEELPEIEFEVPLDDSLEETWESSGPDGKTIYLKVKHSEDKKTVLINWDYKEYEFEIVAYFTGDDCDTSPIAKSTLSIIKNMKRTYSGDGAPSHTENAN